VFDDMPPVIADGPGHDPELTRLDRQSPVERATTPWDPGTYLLFDDERTRPSVDLASRVLVESPASVIDLGCGPGNSTRVLWERWPSAAVTGLDSSAAMIDKARGEHPDRQWILSGIGEWRPRMSYDVVFSNAALQWLPDHGPLVSRLLEGVAPGGALAFQIPSADFALVRSLIREIALEDPWAARMQGPMGALTMEPPQAYYDHLAPKARCVDIWETEYFHVMESHGAIVEWISSTGLRPFLDALESGEEAARFVARLGERVRESYDTRPDGHVLFPFKRTFVVAYR
jgi:trans-aconitate 2-methyltransferase